MKIIPTLKCLNINASLAFYVGILGFKAEPQASQQDESPDYCRLLMQDQELHLSSHSGDGLYGTVVYILVVEVDELFKTFVKRGLCIPKKDSPVHQGPLDQTWGMREFYVDDLNGNTIRFGKIMKG